MEAMEELSQLSEFMRHAASLLAVRVSLELVCLPVLSFIKHCQFLVYIYVCSTSQLRALGRRTRGLVAMRLKEGDKMASMDLIPATMHKVPERYISRVRDLSPPCLLFIAENGRGKRVPLNAFRQSNFNRVGLQGYKLQPDCLLAAVFVVGFSLTDDGESDEQVALVSQSGTVNRIKVKDISIQSRAAKGVILMRLERAGKIQSASLISAAAAEQVTED